MFRPKAAAKEYEKYMLPKNRKEVFQDVVKNNWQQFLLYGCLVLLISLPIHLSAILKDLYRAQLSAAVEGGGITAEQAVLLASSSSNTLALADIVWYVLFAVGFSGLAHLIRQHAWEESVYFRYEYIKGIRQNAGSFARLGLLTGLIRFACVWFQNMLTVNGGGAYGYLGYLPAVWAAVFLIPLAAYMMVCIPIYDVKFYQNLKNAFLVFSKNMWKSLLAAAICGVVFVIQMLPGFWFHITGRLISSFAVPFVTLGWFLFAYDRLDETMNEKLYPQLVGRGILKEGSME